MEDTGKLDWLQILAVAATAVVVGAAAVAVAKNSVGYYYRLCEAYMALRAGAAFGSVDAS